MLRNFISITWTPGLDVRDAQILGRAIEELYRLLRPQFGEIPGQFDPLPGVQVFGAWSLPTVPDGSAFSDMHWYVRRSMDDKQEYLIASRYLETVSLEPWQIRTPHFDLTMTDLPLLDDLDAEKPCSNALGFSRRGMISMISTHPFDELSDRQRRALALQHTCAHFLGRLFDVPRISRQQAIIRLDDQLYCTNVCAMRHTTLTEQALKFSIEEVNAGEVFCPTCQTDIAAQVTGYHYGLN